MVFAILASVWMGLYPTGAAGLIETNGVMRVVDRTEDWQSAEFNAAYAVKGGATVRFSAKLRQHDSARGEFRLTLKIVDETGTRYEKVSEGTSERDVWCALSGEYRLPPSVKELYPFLERVDSLGDYEIGDVKFALAGVQERHPPERDIAPLKDAFHRVGMTCGACVGDAVEADPSGCTKELLLKHFDVLSIENRLKAKFLLRRDGSVDLSPARPWMDFAKTNGLRVAAQALVWSELTPDWFFHEDYDPSRPLASADTMRRRVADYIAAVLDGCEREWPGVIASWVVVNEAVGGEGEPEMEENPFLKTMGPDYVAYAFECAAKHRPKSDCRFLYGECELESKPAKTDYVLDLLKRGRLIERKLVDGIGLQCHLEMKSPTAEDLRSCCAKIAAAGLAAEVNEMDVRCGVAEAGEPLAARYREIFATLLEARRNGLRLDGVTWWGLTDAYSWLTSYYGIETRPLLFDADNRAKPSFTSVVETLR